MAGLLELGPMTREISVMGQPLTIHPLSVDEIIALFTEFPALVQLLTPDEVQSDEPLNIIGPIAIAKLIATATGEGDNHEALKIARQLGIGKSTEIVDKIMEITFEDGIGPFVERLMKRTGDINQLNNLAKPSPARLSAALVGDEPRPIAERLRRANSASGSTTSTETTPSEMQT